MKPVIICLTPVKNEVWILDRFLHAASLWADIIIIADQMSTDGSREIANKYPKVRLIDNSSTTFNEPERQKLLISEARKIKGQRLLIALDADEMFSSEILNSDEWQQILNAKPGTIINFQWANLSPDYKRMWYGDYTPWGYMDDGNDHTGNNKIHVGRIPLPENHISLNVESVKVIHFQYTNWERMKSKHRWYQCYEHVNFPNKKAVDIFRIYHHMFAIKRNEYYLIPTKWHNEYKKLGIDILSPFQIEKIWFDEKVLDLFDEYGTYYFRKLQIWNIDWQNTAKIWGKDDLNRYQDPRKFLDKIIHWWLFNTQPYYRKYFFRRIDNFIKKYLSY